MAEVINLGSIQAPYWENTVTLKANEILKIDYATDSFHLLDVSDNSALRVSFGGSMIETPFTAGMGYQVPTPFQFVQLHNVSNSTITAHFAVGIGKIRDSRLTVSGNVNTIISGNTGFSVVSAGTLTGAHSHGIPANSEVSFMVTSGNITLTANYGNITISGMVLSAGETWQTTIATSGTIAVTGTGTYNYAIGSY